MSEDGVGIGTPNVEAKARNQVATHNTEKANNFVA